MKDYVSEDCRRQWRESLNVLCQTLRVTTALIIRVRDWNVEIFAKNNHCESQFHEGETTRLDETLCCHKVMMHKKILIAPDLRQDPAWQSGFYAAKKMTAYLGFPLRWADGKLFGTLCVLDKKVNTFSKLGVNLMNQIKLKIEHELALITQTEKLQRTEEHYKNLFESSSLGIMLSDEDSNIIDANPMACKITGYAREELITMNGRDLMDPQSNLHPSMEDILAEAVLKGPRRFERVYRTRSGKSVPVEIHVVLISRKGVNHLVLFQDISERKRVERLAMESSNRYRRLVEGLGDGFVIFRLNPDGVITYVSPGVKSLLNVDPEGVEGLKWHQIADWTSESLAMGKVRLRQAKQFYNLRLNFRRSDNLQGVLQITARRTVDGGADVIEGIAADITEHCRMEDELRNKYAQLRDLEEMKDNLAQMIVHDMRSPLTAMISNLELTFRDQDSPLPKKHYKRISMVRNTANELNEMVHSLLDITRFQSGKIELEISQFNLIDVANIAAEVMEPMIAVKQQEVTIAGNELLIEGDRNLILRIFLNLISNAVRFTPVKGWIKVKIRKTGVVALVEVTDSGKGIPEKYHDKIFDKFGQVLTRKDGNKYSFGLGLTFCKMAVEAHYGNIGVKSNTGSGSKFWFTLPLESSSTDRSESYMSELDNDTDGMVEIIANPLHNVGN